MEVSGNRSKCGRIFLKLLQNIEYCLGRNLLVFEYKRVELIVSSSTYRTPVSPCHVDQIAGPILKNGVTDSLLNIASAIETKSIELIKVIKQNIVTLLNTTINFIDEKLYKKLYDLFNMLFQYVIKLSKKSYKEAQKLFNTFLKKAKKDRQ